MHPIVPWLIACVVLAPLPLLLNNAYTQFVVNVMAINIILAVGLNIVKGFAGQVTVGHIALMAIGAYASAVVSTKLGFPFWLALPTAMLITALAGAIVGIPSLRLEGAYLALATLGPRRVGAHLHFRHRVPRRRGRIREHPAALYRQLRRSATTAPTTTS